MNRWEPRLRLIDREPDGQLVCRRATWWERVRYWLGLPARMEGWQQMKEGEKVVWRD